ncbi:hypothetical protein ACEN30_02615 [Marinilactibacillus psychrotolerans]|uniref:hypothetical protein n=1 Tax=Marinilactibacillus psychrotolerans TaxID=191770 RepID=UPI0038858B4F
MLWPFEAKRVTATVLGERRERSHSFAGPFEAKRVTATVLGERRERKQTKIKGRSN